MSIRTRTLGGVGLMVAAMATLSSIGCDPYIAADTSAPNIIGVMMVDTSYNTWYYTGMAPPDSYGCIAPFDQVSKPWADQAYMAEALGRRYVFSRKPNPTLISTDLFDEAAIRADLSQTLQLTRKSRLEIIMKDVHTIKNQTQRLARWVAIAREEIDKAG